MYCPYSLEEELREWFLEKIGQASRNVCNLKDEKSNSIIKRAINYIQNNYTKNIALDDVSLEIDVTPYYFSRLFKEETGINFVEYVTNLRIDKAKELLASVNSISMKEIGIEVGYADSNDFSRRFRKHEVISRTVDIVGILK